MRITGGELRGRVLTSPEGKNTRPTSDRARESVFNILNHAKWLPFAPLDGTFAIDLFAGTGALGLEAISQGASNCIFIEQDRGAAAVCRQTIENFKLQDRARIMMFDATHLPKNPSDVEARQLVFLDPPYGKNLGAAALRSLIDKDWLAKDAVCVLEMSKKEPEEIPAGLKIEDTRDYGIARIIFLTFSG